MACVNGVVVLFVGEVFTCAVTIRASLTFGIDGQRRKGETRQMIRMWERAR